MQKTINYGSTLSNQSLLRNLQQQDLFTKKEQTIIIRMLNRLTKNEIAEKMFLAEVTIKNNVTSIYKKLNVK